MAFDSLFIGVTGLEAYQSAIDTISNNIANTGTTGYKGQDVNFQDLIYQAQSFASAPTQTDGGVNGQQMGLGVKIGSIDTNFAQGGLQNTGVNTNLALNGDGFFILRKPNASGAPVYTRNGDFSLNPNGLFYDASSGLAVQGYMANAQGAITQTGAPGDITIPLGLASQATATGSGTKVGPSANDKVFDVALGGNVDQTQWSQQFLNQVGAAANGGTAKSISTTLYDSLGNAHLATITYTPDAVGSQAATATLRAGDPPDTAAVSIAPATSVKDTITITANAAGTSATITDSLGNTVTGNAGQTITMGGATFTLANPMPANGVQRIDVAPALNGLPTTVLDANSNARVPATRWQVSVSFADGTQFATITKPGSITAAGGPPPVPTVNAPTTGQGSSGTVGYAYFDQAGQFINSSAIEGVAAGQAIGTNASAYIHSANGGTPAILQGNQLNILSWGPSAGNNASSPTAGGAAPQPGPIGFDYSSDTSLGSAYTSTVVSQNGFAAGTLSNVTVGQDGTITGVFTNGQSKTLGQVALAAFQNEQGLERIGSSDFAATANSGLAQVANAGSGRLGQTTINSGYLEQSNVSIADEFTKMIAAQNAYQANSKSITTASEDMQTVIGLIR
ncbi:MAG: flagellar hook-basal body complex protein [Acetobacteraceae bacterium]|nr:flagellar hook-basal body complex protein [Acetobacteraceae bacterium]